MKNIKNLFTLFLCTATPISFSNQTTCSNSIISRLTSQSTKAQSMINAAKSQATALKIGIISGATASTASASGNLLAITDLLSSIDPNLCAFGAGFALATSAYGSASNFRLKYFNDAAANTKRFIFNPTQIRQALDHDAKQIIEKPYTHAISGTMNTKDVLKIAKPGLPILMPIGLAIQAGIAAGGQAFCDGMSCGGATTASFLFYKLAHHYQQQRQNKLAAAEPSTMFDLAREHTTADRLLTTPPQPTTTPRVSPSSDPKN